MLHSLLLLSLFFFTQIAEPALLAPQTGQVLRGRVQIVGNVNVENFSAAELSFSYADQTSGQAWFVIQTFTQIPVDQNLTLWDTTLVTDGDYQLRLSVSLTDGTTRDVVVSGLKIRNDSFPVTVTATATPLDILLPTATESPRQPPTPTPIFSTPTPLPPNPVTITPISIFSNFGQGALVAVVVIFFLSLILRSRKQ